MSSLQAIGLNLALGSSICLMSLIAFDSAIRLGYHQDLAPRTAGRSPEILRNVLRPPYLWSWIPWALRLTYQEMLEGIPGTGTRQQGFAGKRLHCNLDGIILIRFHALCLRVALFASFLGLTVVLPINFTASCDPTVVRTSVCANLTTLTDFEQTTLAHIPPMDFAATAENDDDILLSMEEAEDDGLGVLAIATSFKKYFTLAPGITSRLFVIVLVAWLIYIFAAFQLWNEWIENLALRRVYYLEHDHYNQRRNELAQLAAPVTSTTIEGDQQEHPNATTSSRDIEAQTLPPYIPNPELRDTVPNISLYSVLYKLPEQFYGSNQKKDHKKRDARTTNNENNDTTNLDEEEHGLLDHQLEATADFFDKCVPNQPGFSSSVAAVTILPNSSQVALAWRQWYACAKQLRRLRFIRKRLQHIQQCEEERKQDEEEESKRASNEMSRGEHTPTVSSQDTPPATTSTVPTTISNSSDEASRQVPQSNSNEPPKTRPNSSARHIQAMQTLEEGDSDSEKDAQSSHQARSLLDPTDADVVEEQRRDSSGLMPSDSNSRLGQATSQEEPRQFHIPYTSGDILSMDRIEDEHLKMLSPDDGIEQRSVYMREFALSAAGCCPYGCDMNLRTYDFEKLQEMEEDSADRVREAFERLLAVKAKANKVESHRSYEEDDDGSVDSYIALASNTPDANLNSADWESMMSGTEENSVRKRSASRSAEVSWQQANEIANINRRKYKRVETSRLPELPSGKWSCDWPIFVLRMCFRRESPDIKHREVLKKAGAKSKLLISNAVLHQTYAVVTFTSRQAAVTARQCLADGSGQNRWVEVEDIPIPPLADAAAWQLCPPRSVCRPVTLTINENQKRCRHNCTLIFLVLFYCLYTIPLSLTSNLLSQEKLRGAFPQIKDISVVSGTLTGVLYAIFFSVCPLIFKSAANFGSGATSARQAEFRAIKYYWFFILVTAFTGSSLASMVTEGLWTGLNLGKEAQEVLLKVAKTIPTQVSATWLNWIIVRFLFTLPFMYLFQSNTFIFLRLRLGCLSRAMRGGGPGGPPPFRIYVDSGTVFLCVVALSPACPLIAPAAALFYLVFTPMLRWLLIFVYRPEYDGGGLRWPLLHEMIVSSLVVAQVLLTTMMTLKKAYGPATCAGLAVIPTYMFSQITKDRFLRCYKDAGLLQTSQLDGWDNERPMSESQREDYRKWIVDCHKASFVPVCLSGRQSLFTAEPAVVLPIADVGPSRNEKASYMLNRLRSDTIEAVLPSTGTSQRGAMFRRTTSVNRKSKTVVSPFEGLPSPSEGSLSTRGAVPV